MPIAPLVGAHNCGCLRSVANSEVVAAFGVPIINTSGHGDSLFAMASPTPRVLPQFLFLSTASARVPGCGLIERERVLGEDMRLRVVNSIVMVVERTATAKTRTQCLNVEVGGAAVGLLERGLMIETALGGQKKKKNPRSPRQE